MALTPEQSLLAAIITAACLDVDVPEQFVGQIGRAAREVYTEAEIDAITVEVGHRLMAAEPATTVGVKQVFAKYGIEDQ